MALLLKTFQDNNREWQLELERYLPALDVRHWPYHGDPADIDVAFMYLPPRGELARYPKLRAFINLNVGVDAVLADPALPPDLRIARTVDPGLVELIATYFIYGTIHFHRHFDRYRRHQQQRIWRFARGQPNRSCRVGVMGLGTIGATCAQRLAMLDFSVMGWSRTAKAIPGVTCLAGESGLAGFLERCDVLCCILPLTSATRGMVDAALLARLPAGAAVINAARGSVVVEADLMAALDSGHLSGAMLDVFATEPLPPDSSIWSHPKIVVTPHVAGNTNPATAAPQVAENIRRALAGQALLNEVDRGLGY